MDTISVTQNDLDRIINALNCTDVLDACLRLTSCCINELDKNMTCDLLTVLAAALRSVRGDLDTVDKILLS